MSAITLEVIPEAETVAIIRQERLPVQVSDHMQASFAPHFTAAREILEKSRSVTVTDASQKAQVKLAREYRLGLKNIRVASDKTRKELKDEYLRTGRAIDGFHSILLQLTASEEKRLQEQEDFAERQEAARKLALKSARAEELSRYQFAGAAFLALGDMPEAEYQSVLEGAKASHAAKLAAAEKAEQERQAREKAEAEERERIRLENIRLREEAAKREAELKAEREKVAAEQRAERERLAAEQKAKDEAARKALEAEQAEKRRIYEEHQAKLKAEQEARAKLEAELRAKKEAEERKLAAERRAAKKAALAPDSQKIRAFAGQIRAIPAPAVTSSEAASIVAQIKEQSEKFAVWLEEKASELENPINA